MEICFSYRCELPRTHSVQMLNAAGQPAGSPTLTAWEVWLVNKAKKDRFKLEKQAEEASHSYLSSYNCIATAWLLSLCSFCVCFYSVNCTTKHTFLLHPVWISIYIIYNFVSLELGAVTEGKKRPTRKGAGTEKGCHGREDSRMAKDEKRAGRHLLLHTKQNHTKNYSRLTVICQNFV